MMNRRYILKKAQDGEVLTIVCADSSEIREWWNTIWEIMDMQAPGMVKGSIGFNSGGAIRLRSVQKLDPHYLYGNRLLVTPDAETWAYFHKPETLDALRLAQDEFVNERRAA